LFSVVLVYYLLFLAGIYNTLTPKGNTSSTGKSSAPRCDNRSYGNR